ncbi:mannosyl-3-phosphoglycerate phosphatase [Pararhodobacter sp. CCB-MM2]|uniref:HAD-IIB family hydrolase n=1 Tax=Pararhodobacter sp. CCB-MM2 TaxID=1786003 RepID=UPI00082E617B|nr:HAD-IIB family hydrolase [Pararhodobacter sp. CCB-MM2]
MRLLIFTDLDGTLLDHESYDYRPALPMLARLKAMGAGVVLASSKTGPEIADWQARLGLTDWPAIVENGAALFDGQIDDRDYGRIRAALARLQAPYRGFGDMGVDEVAQVTGLSPEAAALACQRAHTEPGLWHGTEAELHHFLTALEAEGIHARRGGRFLTLGFGGTKAGQMALLTTRYHPEVTLALGDAPNDAEMLTTADWGIVVRNSHGPGLPPLPGENEGRILRTRAEGPEGWVEGLEAVLAKLKIGETDG